MPLLFIAYRRLDYKGARWRDISANNAENSFGLILLNAARMIRLIYIVGHCCL